MRTHARLLPAVPGPPFATAIPPGGIRGRPPRVVGVCAWPCALFFPSLLLSFPFFSVRPCVRVCILEERGRG